VGRVSAQVERQSGDEWVSYLTISQYTQTRWTDLYLGTDVRLSDAPMAGHGTVCFDAGAGDEPAPPGEPGSATDNHWAPFAFRPVQSIGASEIP
jgi:hypothetical protein